MASGCTTVANSLGATRSAPNEFNILTKPPLVVPPEYNLRPPAAGESRPEDNYSSVIAREALLGDVDSAEPSRGEILLMNKANVGSAEPTVRLLIDGENSIEKKTTGFTDRVVFWRDGQAIDGQGSPLNPEEEALRLESLKEVTGGGEVTISSPRGGTKLPGL